MLARVYSASIFGIEAYPVEIEVDINSGLPRINIVGLPDTAVKESKERVNSAIKNSGYVYPQEKITINLAPADIKVLVSMASDHLPLGKKASLIYSSKFSKPTEAMLKCGVKYNFSKGFS